jgi:hypothetical protein
MLATSALPPRFALWSWIGVALAVALTWSRPAAAEEEDTGDKATARQLFHQAGEAMSAGDYAQAADLYARSNALYPAPTAALGEARALVQVGRLLDASERYHALVDSELPEDASDAFKEAVVSARRERKLVMGRLPSLLITLEGDAEVSLDGKPLPPAALGVKRLVDPGEHHIRAVAGERVVFERTVTVAESAVLEVPIRIATDEAPTPPLPPRPLHDAPDDVDEGASDGGAQRTAGFVLLGIGAAGLVVWGATGIVYLGDRSTIDRECDARKLCSQEGLDAVNRGKTVGLVNTVSLFAGLAVAATGLTLVLTAASETTVALTPLLAPSTAALGAGGLGAAGLGAAGLGAAGLGVAGHF